MADKGRRFLRLSFLIGGVADAQAAPVSQLWLMENFR